MGAIRVSRGQDVEHYENCNRGHHRGAIRSMELPAAHAQPTDARFCSTQPLLGDAVVRPSLGRNRGVGAGCLREAHCAGPNPGNVGVQQLRRRER